MPEPVSVAAECGVGASAVAAVLARLRRQRFIVCLGLIAASATGLDIAITTRLDERLALEAETRAAAVRWRAGVEMLESDTTRGESVSSEDVRVALAESLEAVNSATFRIGSSQLERHARDRDRAMFPGLRVRLQFETTRVAESLAAVARLERAAEAVPTELAGCRWQRSAGGLSGECVLDIYTGVLSR